MRFKLILLAVLVAALIGIAASVSINFAIPGPWMPFGGGRTTITLFYLALSLPSAITALSAGIFVYRHTAIRRKLQAALTAILVLLLCSIAFTVLTFY
jgi:hypothetical protein